MGRNARDISRLLRVGDGERTEPSALRASGTTQAPAWPSSAYRRSGPAAPGLRYPPFTGLVMRAAISRRAVARHGSTHAKPYVVGEVHRSTPCRVRRDRASTTCCHDPCLAAHDVPLRGW